MSSSLGRYVAPIVTLCLLLVAWYALVQLTGVSPLVFPSPISVSKAILANAGPLLYHTGITLLESVLGFLLGGSAAFVLAASFVLVPRLSLALFPYAIGLKAVPLVALAPLVAVWFGVGLGSKVVLSAVISFFPILVNSVQGMTSVDARALDLLLTMTATPLQVLRRVRIPHALPTIFAGMRVSSTFAVVGAVVAEFVGSKEGIGHVVKAASYYLDSPLLFAGTLFAAAAGLMFFGLIVLVERRVLHWSSELPDGRDLRG